MTSNSEHLVSVFHLVPNTHNLHMLRQYVTQIMDTFYLPRGRYSVGNLFLYPQHVGLDVAYLTEPPSIRDTLSPTRIRIHIYSTQAESISFNILWIPMPTEIPFTRL